MHLHNLIYILKLEYDYGMEQVLKLSSHALCVLQSMARERERETFSLQHWFINDNTRSVSSNRNVHLLNLDVFDKLIVFRDRTRQGTSATEVGNYG